MRKFIMLLIAAFIAVIGQTASANEAAVKAALLKKYPQIQIQSVLKTPLAGMYEVYADGQLHYTDEKATYLFVNARMIDTD